MIKQFTKYISIVFLILLTAAGLVMLFQSPFEKEELSAFNIQVKDETGGVVLILSSVLPIILPFLLIVLFFWYMFGQAQKGSMQAFSFGKSKARLASSQNGKKKVTFADIAGLIEAKEEISEVVEFLKEPKKFHKLGAKLPRGIL